MLYTATLLLLLSLLLLVVVVVVVVVVPDKLCERDWLEMRVCVSDRRRRHSDDLPPYLFTVRISPGYLVGVGGDKPSEWVSHH